MKLSLVLLSVFVIFSSLGAQAQSLKLMGKGLAKRGSQESIALACVNAENCTELQFVYFNGPGEPQWVGPKIAMPTAPTEELREKAVQTKVAVYMASNPAIQKEQKKAEGIRNKASWAVMIGVGAAACAAGPMTLGAAVIYFAPIAVAGVFLRAFPPRSLDAFLVGSGDFVTVSKVSDQNGWSWSSEPKKVSAKKFDRLMQNLKTQARYYSYGDGGPMDQVAKKMRKLEKEGVDFNFQNRTGQF
jgi:hypothetical protein